MKCTLCEHDTVPAFSHEVRKKYRAHYVICPRCDYMFTVNPTWISEAYAQPINTTDTGYVMRNIYLSRKTLVLFSIVFGIRSVSIRKFLDYAGGYGMLTRIMRDYGLQFFSDDPYTTNLFAQGFEYKPDTTSVDGLTCFECFEHLIHPLVDIEKMLTISKTIFFSTRLKPIGVVPHTDWEYYGFNHGQHTSFYSEKTFLYIAHKYNLNYYTDGNNLHIFSQKKLMRHIMKITNIIVKFQLDILIRKMLKSRTHTDHVNLIKKGF